MISNNDEGDDVIMGNVVCITHAFFSRVFYYLMAIWSVNPYFQIHPTIIVLIVYSHYHLKIGVIPIII